MDSKVAIVGGGLAGLALADHLTRLGQDWHLVEARPRLGGRIKSLQDGGASFDLGPSWFWPGQPRMAALTQRLGLTVFDQYAQGALSFEDAQHQVHRGVGYASMQGAWRIAGGMAALTEALVAKLDPAHIQTGVAAVQVAPGQVTLSDGTALMADQIVLAIPPRVAGMLRFAPGLPETAAQALAAIPTWMGGQAKVVATYDHAFWRDAGLSGDAQSNAPGSPLVEIHDASALDGPAALFGFVGIQAELRRGAAKEITRAAIAQLTRLFGPDAASPRRAVLEDWATQPETASTLDQTGPTHHPDYGLPHALTGLWDNCLHFCATETALQFGGYLEGALASARATAERLSQ